MYLIISNLATLKIIIGSKVKTMMKILNLTLAKPGLAKIVYNTVGIVTICLLLAAAGATPLAILRMTAGHSWSMIWSVWLLGTSAFIPAGVLLGIILVYRMSNDL